MALTVSKVARLARVSVRTLHHYDEIGLIRPSGRSDAGYRLYEHADLERLQQVLFFRELGFALEDIGRILTDPEFDQRAALLMQRQLLEEKRERLSALIRGVDAALDALEKGQPMNEQSMFDAFGDFDPTDFEDEVQQRWSDTEAYREWENRRKRYREQDWKTIKAEGDRIFIELAAVLGAGHKPGDCEAVALAEQHRRFIDKWFYPCSPAMHGALGEMYVSDSRFSENLDQIRPGLAKFAREAFRANAQTHEREDG